MLKMALQVAVSKCEHIMSCVRQVVERFVERGLNV
jgi:hypothetical protein